MIDEQALLKGLQKLLKDTEASIRERLADVPPLESELRVRHAEAVRAERTEGSVKGYNAFKDESVTQSAVHWLLGCVFVRFLEDNGWLDERNAKVAWIAGAGERLWVAKSRRTVFLRPNADETDRDYLLHVFEEVAKLPGVAGLFDPERNPLYLLKPTGQGAGKIVEFFQRVDPDSNQLIHDFTDAAHGTRFLGDLYQNLSDYAQEKYALCQTPGFVIDFILDRTLAPALDVFGLETAHMIDPSCGSGHFLLAAFARLFRLWQGKEPGTNPPTLAQRALDALYGVDLNPFAVEITRFRLLIAAMDSCGITRLVSAPAFRFNVAIGDALLHGRRPSDVGGAQTSLFKPGISHFYNTEDAAELARILGQEYHAVVGNPPYITVEDEALRAAYRDRFSTCHRSYQLGVPFTERFFDLCARSEEKTKSAAGFIGLIVSDAFMKRAFGKKLVEQFLVHRDLTHVIHTTGVYLPGHGTPTTILFGRSRRPVLSSIRAVRGIKGGAGVPEDPANAPIWREIVEQVDTPGFLGNYVSVADAPRMAFKKHPWPIGGGGAAELKEDIEAAAAIRLKGVAVAVGRIAVLGEEDAWFSGSALCHRMTLSLRARPFVAGENVREWGVQSRDTVLYPASSGESVGDPGGE
jgi:type I restriction-modification system DNA methylase subunit